MDLQRSIQDHPRPLEWAYRLAHRLFFAFGPLIARIGYKRVERLILTPERLSKEMLFDCRMCGQCILHSTGMTCPMTCPKNLRNGPCGGVRLDNHCEVKPEMVCVWFDAYHRSRRLLWPEEFHDIHPPVDRQLEHGSAWVNHLVGRDQIVSGCETEPRTGLTMVRKDA
ncbi:MAG: methylenetetrahydrofolate reductase C-terminal domain-containing protein [Anaerolineae bacterium]